MMVVMFDRWNLQPRRRPARTIVVAAALTGALALSACGDAAEPVARAAETTAVAATAPTTAPPTTTAPTSTAALTTTTLAPAVTTTAMAGVAGAAALIERPSRGAG